MRGIKTQKASWPWHCSAYDSLMHPWGKYYHRFPTIQVMKLQPREVKNLNKIKKLESGRVRIRKGTAYEEDKRVMN